MKQRPAAVVLLVTALLMVGILGCSVGRRIVKGPDPATATPTATRRPTYTPTASPTFAPSATSKPTNTATLVAPPTNTPEAAPAQTNTPVPPTRKPAPKPKAPAAPPTPTAPPAPPPPTNTPAPSTPYVGKVATGFPNCGSTGIFGFVRDTSNRNVGDIHVRVWTDKWEGLWAKSTGDSFGNDGDRNFEIKIAEGVAPGSWHVAIVKEKKSEEMLSPIVEITSSEKCEGDGAVQWTKIEFTKYS